MRVTRAGSSLVELLAALVVGALLASVAFRLLDRTQRFAHGLALVTDERAQLAGAAGTIRESLEGLSVTERDLLAAHDSSVSFHGAVGHAVACVAAGVALDLAPPSLASGVILTSWTAAPQPGDVVSVFDEGARLGLADDRWASRSVASAASLAGACAGTPFIDPVADAGKSGWRLTLASPLPSTVTPGAAVRTVRRQRLALYRSAGEWALGWTEWNAAGAAWQVIQPLAAPLQPYAPAPQGGLAFGWRDSSGVPLPAATATLAARIDVRVRAPTAGAVRMDGMARGTRVDSSHAALVLRNRR